MTIARSIPASHLKTCRIVQTLQDTSTIRFAMSEDFVVIDLGDDGPLRFSTPKDITDWVLSEQNEWSWITSRGPAIKGQLRDTTTRYNQFFEQTTNAVSTYANDKSRENLQNRIDALFNNFVRNKLIAISRTKHGAVILQLLKDAGGPTSDIAAKRAVAALVHMGTAEDGVGINVPYARQATLAMIDYSRTQMGMQAHGAAGTGAILGRKIKATCEERRSLQESSNSLGSLLRPSYDSCVRWRVLFGDLPKSGL